MQGYTIDQLTVGQQASFSKTISESDVYMFAGVTGDVNPAHVNEAYAQTTAFKTRSWYKDAGAGSYLCVTDIKIYSTCTYRRYHYGNGDSQRNNSGAQQGCDGNCVPQSG